MKWNSLRMYKSFHSIFKMKLKDLVVSVVSFILGCFVTINFISIGIHDPSNGVDFSEGSALSLKNEKDIKLFSSISYFLIVVIISGADNFIQRTAIRESWGLFNKDFADVQYFFIIGSYGLSNEKILKLKNEQIKYNDLFIMSVSDSYKTLTKKALHAFVWFEAEFNFKYILKCDDDSFVVLPKVVDELQNSLSKYEHLYWGYFSGKARVHQRGKWKENDWFLCDRYLPYAIGGGYVLSRSLIRYIRENEKMFRTYLSEDVSVGVWLSPLNITRFHDIRFDTEYKSRGCHNNYIVTHKKTPQDMKLLYSMYTQSGKLCERETKIRKTYEYNWKVLPTQCCISNEPIDYKSEDEVIS